MAAGPAADIPKREICLDCGDYLLRTVTGEDASDRWASWMAEPKNLRLLNAAPKAMTPQDIVRYINQFDQRSHLLIGIFEKLGGSQIGFFRLDIDHRLKRCLMFLLIGEQKYRHWRVTDDIRGPFQDYIFDALGLNTILATVLESNQAMIRYMLKSGWTFDKRSERHVKSQTDGTMLDLCFMHLSREAWMAWK
ncbi:MAG TPA: GNAT family protein, partial [Pseudolabrys sp.]|nr:GNAT family protein [Pseudolabrys sp.]